MMGVCIMQVFDSGYGHTTTQMLRVYDGALTYYRSIVLVAGGIYDRWFYLYVIHDKTADHSGDSHYFKYWV
ncbi:hypothetical protein QJS04_geneDACA022749 [Acorus gramineus]|uniref:Uncharacterized protein n=1 Tax=Acorus gramineus TaxID=55184 RepID=A0AAV9AI78_ACOGR|nr:hypothetical protein QJS04_geneDACA022749 [Acorus gramineus]